MEEIEGEDTSMALPAPSPEDASIYLAEMKKQALDHLFAKDGPYNLITKFKGRHPNIYVYFGALVEWEILSAMEERRKIKWENLDPIRFLIANVPSIGGWRSNQGVEIARAAPSDHRHSLLDILRGR